ncbi:MAG: acyltransferase [Xanthomonadales bacterium]|mgnify:CR=1 FL=1|nr:acyltransferase [Xanthomonadales bacterium]
MSSGSQLHRGNNFDCIRLIAAASVLVSHQFALHDASEPIIFGYQTLGGYAVMIFFSISGYLIAGSWVSDPNLRRFALRRLLRIWPGLLCTVLLCGLILGPLVTEVPLREYFGSVVTLKFFGTGLFVVSPFLPGVFPYSPVAYIPNGVLWTIPIELRCYIYLAVLGLLGIVTRRWVLLACLVALSVWYYGIHDAEAVFDATHTHLFEVEYATFFFSGVCLYLFRKECLSRRGKLVGSTAAVALAAIAYITGHELIAAFLLTPYLVIAFGTASYPVLRQFGRFGDMSYGVYIYAFPIQQLVIWLTPMLSIYEHFVIVVPATFVMAWLSWHFVEKIALGYKPKTPRVIVAAQGG